MRSVRIVQNAPIARKDVTKFERSDGKCVL